MGLAASGTKAIAQHLISRVAAGLPEMGQKLRPGRSAAWGWTSGCSAWSVRAPAGAEPQNNFHCVAWQDAEAICASLAGGALLQNGQMTAEIQEEVALTNLGSSSGASKRHSATDKMHFPRSNLQTITTLGMLGHPVPVPTSCRSPVSETPAHPSQRTGCAGCIPWTVQHTCPNAHRLSLCLSALPGRGEFGEVFLAKAKGAEDGEGEALVLVKSLQTRDEQLQLDFRREAEMFGKLNHANVVRLLGLCREAEPHYMVLEYVDLVRPCQQGGDSSGHGACKCDSGLGARGSQGVRRPG